MAAYQSLGPFISTFADPCNSGFYVDQHGKLCKFVIPVKSEGESSSEETIGDEKKYVKLTYKTRSFYFDRLVRIHCCYL